MHGLTRVRQFTISEGHLIIRPDQVEEELAGCLDLAVHCLTTLGLQDDVTYRLSKWDPDNREKYLGDEEYWEKPRAKSVTCWLRRMFRLQKPTGKPLSTDRKLISRQKCVRQRRYHDYHSAGLRYRGEF